MNFFPILIETIHFKKLFRMLRPSSILGTLSDVLFPDYETANLKTLFAQGFTIQTANCDLLNTWVIHRFYEYTALNAKDYNL